MYEFKYDSVQGRRQLGAVGSGLEKVIPDSVEVHERSIYPSPVKVRNIYMGKEPCLCIV